MKQHPIDHYLIYIRPNGSRTWTLWTFAESHQMRGLTPGVSTPWRNSDPGKADHEAILIAEHTIFCARVVPVRLPAQLDTCITATLADGDSTYVPAEPKEVA